MKNKVKAEVQNALDILRLRVHTVEKVALDDGATGWGIAFLFVPFILNLFLGSFMFPSGFGAIFSRFLFWPMLIPVLSVVGAVFAMIFFVHKALNKSGGACTFMGVFRVVAYSSIVLWLTIIPFTLNIIFGIDPYGFYNLLWWVGLGWVLTVSYQVLLHFCKLDKESAFFALGIGLVSYFFFQWFLGWILVGSSYRMLF